MVRTSKILMIGAIFAGIVAVATPVAAKTVKITVAAAPPPLVTFVGAFKDIVTKKIV